MIISHSHKFIFIHNYKAAGASIRNVLNIYNFYSYSSLGRFPKLLTKIGVYPRIYCEQFNQHSKAIDLKEKLPTNIFNNYFKFGFVRNPYDWQVSLYHWMLKDETHCQHQLIKSLGSFDKYIEWRVNEDLHLQKDFFYDADNNLLVDYIGKFETLSCDILHIQKKLKLKETKLPHKNHSKHKHFSDYITASAELQIYNAFKDDFITFNYKRLKIDLTQTV